MVECDTPYTEKFTRLFYANLRMSDDSSVCTTYMLGKLINLLYENLANWLDL